MEINHFLRGSTESAKPHTTIQITTKKITALGIKEKKNKQGKKEAKILQEKAGREQSSELWKEKRKHVRHSHTKSVLVFC